MLCSGAHQFSRGHSEAPTRKSAGSARSQEVLAKIRKMEKIQPL